MSIPEPSIYTSVPDTNIFTLRDVVNVVGGPSLQTAFDNAIDSNFDPINKGDKNNLLNFRNYKNKTVIQPDYVVLRYSWGFFTGGIDLDTITVINTCGVGDITNVPVGFGKNQYTRDSILQWGGDNRDTGNETVLIRLNKLKIEPSLIETSIIDIYGNWYSSKAAGICYIELSAYKDGIMSLNGFTWVNTGGELISSVSYQIQVDTVGVENLNTYNTGGYTKIGYIRYIKSLDIAELII